MGTWTPITGWRMPRAEGAYSQEGRMSQASISLKRMDNSRIQGVQHGNRGTAATHGVSDEEPRFKYSPSGPPFPHGPRLGDLSFAHCESTCGCNKFYGSLPNPCRDTQIRTALGQFGKCMFGFRLVFHGERQLSNVAVQLHFGARYFEKGSGILKNAPTF